MKKYGFSLLFFLLCAFLSACGKKGGDESVWIGVQPGMEDLTALTDRTEYYDLVVEAEELFDLGLWEKNLSEEFAGDIVYVPLGTQFYQGEPVQLWAEERSESSDVYLYRKNGDREVLLQDVPVQYTRRNGFRWYLDQEGDFYCICNANYSLYEPDSLPQSRKAETALTKILSSGEVLFEKVMEPNISLEDICQLEDGRVYLQLSDQTEGSRQYAEVDPETGAFSSTISSELFFPLKSCIGKAGSALAVTGYASPDAGRQVAKINQSNEKMSPVLFFTGTSYAWHGEMNLQDFRVLEDGSVELLWTDYEGTGGLLERLQMAKVEKIPIILRGVFGGDSWITERVALFNRENDTYHVILEDCGGGNDADDFARLTNVQIGAGKGPDILCGEKLLRNSIAGMLDKGALEELNPYMEATGIREEDYFPLTFAAWRQGEQIYSISPRANILGYRMDAEVLGGSTEPDIKALADALLSRKEDGIYMRGIDSGRLLEMLLEGTEDLWGMVDWESRTCDFTDPLFEKLLETARRFGDDGRKDPGACIAEQRFFYDIFRFDSRAKQENEGKVTSGILFDDGCYGGTTAWYAMAVNKNSQNKEGAWEFISFLIGEEVQSRMTSSILPVNRKAFEEWLRREVKKGYRATNSEGEEIHYTEEDITEEKIAEYKEAIESARPFPSRTAPLLEMIREEAEDYFIGTKSAEEVIELTANRVQLYLEETR